MEKLSQPNCNHHPRTAHHQAEIDIVQGEDMGMRSLIKAKIPALPGSSIAVSGTARIIGD